MNFDNIFSIHHNLYPSTFTGMHSSISSNVLGMTNININTNYNTNSNKTLTHNTFEAFTTSIFYKNVITQINITDRSMSTSINYKMEDNKSIKYHLQLDNNKDNNNSNIYNNKDYNTTDNNNINNTTDNNNNIDNNNNTTDNNNINNSNINTLIEYENNGLLIKWIINNNPLLIISKVYKYKNIYLGLEGIKFYNENNIKKNDSILSSIRNIISSIIILPTIRIDSYCTLIVKLSTLSIVLYKRINKYIEVLLDTEYRMIGIKYNTVRRVVKIGIQNYNSINRVLATVENRMTENMKMVVSGVMENGRSELGLSFSYDL